MRALFLNLRNTFLLPFRPKAKFLNLLGAATPIFFGIFFAFQAFAQDTGITPITDTASAHSAICNVFNAMFYVLIAVSVIMVLWAAYLYATAQDDVEKTSSARNTILYAGVAIVVALLAKGFPIMIAGIFKVSGISGC